MVYLLWLNFFTAGNKNLIQPEVCVPWRMDIVGTLLSSTLFRTKRWHKIFCWSELVVKTDLSVSCRTRIEHRFNIFQLWCKIVKKAFLWKHFIKSSYRTSKYKSVLSVISSYLMSWRREDWQWHNKKANKELINKYKKSNNNHEAVTE